MRKVILSVMVLVLMCSLVLAAGQQGIHEPGTGIENPEIKAAGQGTGQGLEEGEVQGAGQGVGQGQGIGQGQKVMAQTGNYVNQMGKQMKVQQQENNRFKLEVGGVSADCPLDLTQEEWENRTKLYAGLSNGKNAEIKIMPDTASETALQRLGLRNCDEDCLIELKEVGSGEQIKAAYELRTQRNSRVLGLFRARMNVQAQVDAETGELVQVNKPWWAFLATEPEESSEESVDEPTEEPAEEPVDELVK
jgi:hypothetical protein